MSFGQQLIYPPARPWFRSDIEGLIPSRDSGDTSHDTAISAGAAILTDGTNYKRFRLSAEIVKQIDANWAEGNDAGGFPSGLTLTTATWYHLYLIGKDDGTVDAGYDTDAVDASNLLTDASDYTWYRLIGSVLTDGSSNITSYRAHEVAGGSVLFSWAGQVVDRNSTSALADADFTITVPLGLEVEPIVVSRQVHNVAGSGDCLVGDAGATARLYLVSTSNLAQRTAGAIAGGFRTNTSSQIRYALVIGSGSLSSHLFQTQGWIFARRLA